MRRRNPSAVLGPGFSGRRTTATLRWPKGPARHVHEQGDDNLGALADIQRMLLEADVETYASSGVTDGSGRFGYVIYFKEADHARAARVLGAVTPPKTA